MKEIESIEEVETKVRFEKLERKEAGTEVFLTFVPLAYFDKIKKPAVADFLI